MRNIDKSKVNPCANKCEHENIDSCEKCENLQLQVEVLEEKLKWYEEQFKISQAQKYGSKSEQVLPEQLSAFNEVEKESRQDKEEPVLEEVVEKRSRIRKPTGERFADLPEEVIEYDLSDEEKSCPKCGKTLHQMSKEIRQEIVVIPATVKIVKHVQPVYACRNCEKDGIQNHIITAKAPEPVIPHGFASASLIAFIMNRKYAECVPLYRQEQQWINFGLELSRQNMANWVIKGSEHLAHIYHRLKEVLLEERFLHADETTMQILAEPGKKATSKSYMWMYCTGRFGPEIFLYEYQPSRSGNHPEKFLKGFNGYLQTDGYTGYDSVENVTHMGCLAHARRKFVDALKAMPKDADISKTLATVGRKYCDKLFILERKYKDLSPKDRLSKRKELSQPVFKEFHEWLVQSATKALPKSALGKAINYCIKQWDYLSTFLLDGEVELSNNRAERAIKPFVIGRKNFLFSKTPNGAKASAICYSIIETAKANGLSPYHYLTHLLEMIPNINVHDKGQIEKLLPWSENLPNHCRVPAKS